MRVRNEFSFIKVVIAIHKNSEKNWKKIWLKLHRLHLKIFRGIQEAIESIEKKKKRFCARWFKKKMPKENNKVEKPFELKDKFKDIASTYLMPKTETNMLGNLQLFCEEFGNLESSSEKSVREFLEEKAKEKKQFGECLNYLKIRQHEKKSQSSKEIDLINDLMLIYSISEVDLKKVSRARALSEEFKKSNHSKTFLKSFLDEKMKDKSHIDTIIRLLSVVRVKDVEKYEIFLFDPDQLKSFLAETSDLFGRIAANGMKKAGQENKAVVAPPLRTPTGVIIDLLHFMERGDHGLEDADKKGLEKEIKQAFLNHQLSLEKTKKLLVDISSQYENTKLAEKCSILDAQLAKETYFTLLNDNIYGRVFESAFVGHLVENPPKGVQKAMSQMGLGLASDLQDLLDDRLDPATKEKVSEGIRHFLNHSDPRFWFSKTPDLQKIKSASENVLELLIEYLKKPKRDGFECISIPYLIVKVSLVLQGNKHGSDWFTKATEIYHGRLQKLQSIRRENGGGERIRTKTAGITLHYQPPMLYDESMEPSRRPTTERVPEVNSTQYDQESMDAIKKSLSHEIPWASGISGSTAMSLYACDYFNSLIATEKIDIREALLGIMMFLVYDGGHSLHESLWAASEIDKLLNLGLDKLQKSNPSGKIEDFISEYDIIPQLFDEQSATHQLVREAFDESFEEVIAYFEKYSPYAQK